MKFLFALSLIPIVYALPLFKLESNDPEATIVEHTYNNYGDGKYDYRFMTSNFINRYETGEIRNKGLENEYLFVQGGYSYYDPDGKFVSVTYTADENGYREDVKPSAGSAGGGYSPALVASIIG